MPGTLLPALGPRSQGRPTEGVLRDAPGAPLCRSTTYPVVDATTEVRRPTGVGDGPRPEVSPVSDLGVTVSGGPGLQSVILLFYY